MRYAALLLFIFFAMAITSCTSSADNSDRPVLAVIQKKIPLPGIPSASGIEKVGDYFYVIGDDCPYLFCLDQNYAVVQKKLLVKNATLAKGRIPKSIKPDLESITTLRIAEQPYLLILGSGSTDRRNVGFLVSVAGENMGKPRAINLAELFSPLAANPQVVGQATLNIEGLAADEEYVYLLQRFSPSGQNTVLTYSIQTLLPFLLGQAPAPAPFNVVQWALPDLKNVATGFSGATAALGGRLLFTASAEETPDAILDGEVHGSLVGWLRTHARKGQGQELNAPTAISPITEADGTLYKGKIESICILQESKHSVHAVVVTDSDDGLSELLEIHFTW